MLWGKLHAFSSLALLVYLFQISFNIGMEVEQCAEGMITNACTLNKECYNDKRRYFLCLKIQSKKCQGFLRKVAFKIMLAPGL